MDVVVCVCVTSRRLQAGPAPSWAWGGLQHTGIGLWCMGISLWCTTIGLGVNMERFGLHGDPSLVSLGDGEGLRNRQYGVRAYTRYTQSGCT